MNAPDATELERLSTEGYLFVSPDPTLRQEIEHLLALASQFFDGSLEEKERYSTVDRREGYRPFGSEYSLAPDVPDLTESFSCARANADVRKRFREGVGSALYDQMLIVGATLADLAESLTSKLFTALTGRPPRRFGIARWSRLQVNCSWPDAATHDIIHHRHEDSDLLTVALATERGLEIETAVGDWQGLPHGLDRLLIVPSEVLWLLTGGAIRPLYHRVVRTPGIVKRLALLYFVDADPGASEAWVVNEINRGIDIGSRVFTNSLRYGVPPVRNREEVDQD